jgi:hypothetical protein
MADERPRVLINITAQGVALVRRRLSSALLSKRAGGRNADPRFARAVLRAGPESGPCGVSE